MRSISRLITISALLLSGVTKALALSPAPLPVGSYDPLQDSHLVVRGTLKSAIVEKVALGDWGVLPREDPGSTRLMRVTKLTIELSEVMRGDAPSNWTLSSPVTIYSAGGISALFQGDHEYILCCKLFVKAGKYMTGDGTGIYSKVDTDGWTRVHVEADAPVEHVTTAEIRARISSASLESVTASSAVIVRGRILSIRRATYSNPGGQQGELTVYAVHVQEQLKGAALPQEFDFVVPRANGSVVPEWFRWVPSGVNIGEEWLLFLREGELGLYPFAGPNSMLRIDGTSLTFDLAVPCHSSVLDALRKIRSDVAREN